MPFGRVFETLSWGRRHVVMGANQIDRYGNQNLSAFGPAAAPDPPDVRRPRRAGQRHQPRDELLGGQPLQARLRRCRRHRLAASAGTRSTPPTPPTGSSTSTGWSPTSACSTSTGPTTRCARCRCIPGSRPTRSRENTSFEVHDLDSADRVPAAHRRRADADPRGHRPEVTAGQGSTGMSQLKHAADRTARHRAPGRADRHGLGGGCAAGGGDVERRRPRHPRVGDDDARRTGDRGAKVKAATDKPFGINIRADAGDAARPRRPADPRGRAGSPRSHWRRSRI